MKRIHVLILVVLSLGIMTAPHTYAEDVNPCEKDIAKLCKNIEPGDGRILRCLTLSKEDLRPPCKKQFNQIEKAVEEVQNACADDYALFCSSVLPGQGRIAACLEKNQKILTPKCKTNLAAVKQKAKEIQEQMKKK
ncbi:MAG: cysteine rich repeat-containing protein [Thermodesulfovibrionales bacterium]|nr:cysteine rich repeat-containing protein [Thermodesulfovibrionales bacterium]